MFADLGALSEARSTAGLLLGSSALTLDGNDHDAGRQHDDSTEIKNLAVFEAGTTS